MRSLLLLAATLALSGCARQPRAVPSSPAREARGGFAIVEVDDASYLIDPFSQSCFLRHWYGNSTLLPVPCDKLKQNLLAAARYITWISAPKRSTGEAGQTPPPPAPQASPPQPPPAPAPQPPAP